MKLKIYEPEKIVKEEELVRLAFKRYGKSISVTVVDKNGNKVPRGDLLQFGPSGRVYLHSNVNEALGFKLNQYGEIKVGIQCEQSD